MQNLQWPNLRILVLIGTVLLLTVSIAAAATRMWLDPQNRLIEYADWYSTKLELNRNLAGAGAFSRDTQALAGNFINLSSWGGYNEIVYKQPVALKQLGFKFRLYQDAVLYVVPSQPDVPPAPNQPYNMIRFSTSERFPTSVIETDRSGRFFQNLAIEGASLTTGVWHTCVLNVVPGGLEITVDGQRWGSVPMALAAPGHVAFRGNTRPMSLDNIEIQGIDGFSKKETFDQYSRWKVRVTVWAITAAGVLVLLLLLRALSRRSTAAPAYAVTVLTCIAMMAWAGVYLERVQLAQYPKVEGTYLEKREQDILDRVREKRIPEIVAEAASLPGEADCRILFIGSSQTWGAGAWNDNEGVVRQTGRLLSEALPDRTIQCINAGISGSNSNVLFELYAREWIHFAPSLVVVNLAWNDLNAEEFGENLRILVELNRSRGIETVFIQEAFAEELRIDTTPKHSAILETGKQLGIPVFRGYPHMRTGRHQGILWWDAVHPTSFGHLYLASGIVEFLQLHVDGLRPTGHRKAAVE